MSNTLNDISVKLTQLLDNYTSLQSTFHDMYYNETPMDIILNLYDSSGNLQEYTIPNRAKDLQYVTIGENSPESVKYAGKGTLYSDTVNGNLYIKTTDISLNTGWNLLMSSFNLEENLRKGSINPEGNVTANKGTLYSDTSEGKLYIKSTDGGNTGWGKFITVLSTDNAPIAESNNLISSGGVYTALLAKQNTLTFDSTSTSGSTNPVTSGGIHNALSTKQDSLGYTAENSANKSDSYTVSSSTTYASTKALVDGLATKQDTLTAGTGVTIANNVISVETNLDSTINWGNIVGDITQQTDLYNALANKQATLTIDSAPTSGSSNICTSGGIYTALNNAATNLNADNITSGTINNTYMPNNFGTCSKIASGVATVVLSGFVLATGVTITVLFNSTMSPTSLNVNNIGAISITDESNVAIDSYASFPTNSTVEFTYNGVNWMYKRRCIVSKTNYRIFNDGWKECWGTVTFTSAYSGSGTTNYPISFTTFATGNLNTNGYSYGGISAGLTGLTYYFKGASTSDNTSAITYYVSGV